MFISSFSVMVKEFLIAKNMKKKLNIFPDKHTKQVHPNMPSSESQHQNKVVAANV